MFLLIKVIAPVTLIIMEIIAKSIFLPNPNAKTKNATTMVLVKN